MPSFSDRTPFHICIGTVVYILYSISPTLPTPSYLDRIPFPICTGNIVYILYGISPTLPTPSYLDQTRFHICTGIVHIQCTMYIMVHLVPKGGLSLT